MWRILFIITLTIFVDTCENQIKIKWKMHFKVKIFPKTQKFDIKNLICEKMKKVILKLH